MWADSKTVGFLKFYLTVQKLLNIEIFLFLHCFYGVMEDIVTFKHRITFDPLNQISKS